MTPGRESFVLPGIFLTVALLGGLRLGTGVRLVPPALSALTLGVLLVGALARSRVFVPAELLGPQRTPLENASGLVVLLCIFAACAQAFNLVMPDESLLHAIFGTFFFVQLLTTFASVRSRRDMLRNLAVLFGAAFVLRFILLEALYSDRGGVLKRVLVAMLEVGTLGTLTYSPNAPGTGYVAFATLLMFLVGLFLLRDEGNQIAVTTSIAPRRDAPPAPYGPLCLLAAALTASACASETTAPVLAGQAPAAEARAANRPAASAAMRDAGLRSARVWTAPATPISEARLDRNPDGPRALQPDAEVECRLVLDEVSGTTPKFRCALPGGEVVKVKYGRQNAELRTEVAATRLLAALGFGADRMYVVRRVRCLGCPRFPYQALRCLQKTGLERVCFAGGIDYRDATDFSPAVVERRLEGRPIEAAPDQGWAWFELDRISAAHGGSARSEVDALKLMALLLAHWDNKAANQRLVCPPAAERPDGSCAAPFAILQDVGATFGPTKAELLNWRRAPIWKDPRTCTVSMEQLPWNGATFPEQRVSEEGRVFFLQLLEQLSRAQIEALFESSGIASLDSVSAENRQPAAWAQTFLDKVREIRDAGPCPPVARVSSLPAR